MAGGIGTRMNSEVPKQFLCIDGDPIIVHSIRRFMDYNKDVNIIVVLPENHVEQWKNIKLQYFPNIEIGLTTGGATRTASVISGLNLIDEGLVAIHDAVRPFTSFETISNSFLSAEIYGSGVAAVSLKDSIREIQEDQSVARDRSNYVLVQTPQTFKVGEIKSAYAKIGTDPFTDDASVYEAAGNIVRLVKGTYNNIKITTPEDLK